MRQLCGSRRDNDSVVGRELRNASSAIAHHGDDIFVTHGCQLRSRRIGQSWMPLNGDDLCNQFRQQRRHVARTSSDLQHSVGRQKREGFEHQRHDVRLRDGLAFRDRKGMIFIGLRSQVAREQTHGAAHAASQ